MCDVVALSSGKLLARELIESGFNVVIHAPLSTRDFGDKKLSKHILSQTLKSTPRSVLDMNRSMSRSSQYRTELTKYLKKNASKVVFHFDVHSFPPKEKPRRTGIYVIVGDNWDKVGLSKMEYEGRGGIVFGGRTRARVFKSPAPCKEKQCDRESNDLIDETATYGVPGLLIEFDESLSMEKRGEMCSDIVKWLMARVG